MAINKKLIHFKNKQKFNEELANGNILDSSIVFILDTTEIYTHGTLYDGSTFDPSNIETSLLNKADKSFVEDNYYNKSLLLEVIEQELIDRNLVQAVDTNDTIDEFLSTSLLAPKSGFINNDYMKFGITYILDMEDSELFTITNLETPNENIVDYRLHFSTSTNNSISLPDYIYWANGNTLEIEDNIYYELCITATKHKENYIYKAVLIPFKSLIQ